MVTQSELDTMYADRGLAPMGRGEHWRGHSGADRV